MASFKNLQEGREAGEAGVRQYREDKIRKKGSRRVNGGQKGQTIVRRTNGDRFNSS